MKSLLPRTFSRSLPTLLPSSRSNNDHMVTLPDYYRNTRREVYGPYFSTETQSVRTMEMPYGNPDESYRSSFLLVSQRPASPETIDSWSAQDIEPPEEQGLESKTHSTENLGASSLPSLCASIYFDEVPIPPPMSEKPDCFRVGRALLHVSSSVI
ncbi:hypothetical protein AN958_03811 [Leucoagaricus sp. SymC.cos]|nr:hypothetical protein AN958_03811 [Leucoagaricus sp. SymC.cos]